MKHYRIIFSGKAQGVFFRRNTYLKAVELDISGYVRNLENGSVEVVAQGKKEMIDALIEFCKDGQTYAKVEKIKVEKYNSNKIWPDFSIKHEA
jgi:acylphosphatase